jgi:light-regulated signal transduction histidine kinase (bacteriophytochrome)
MMNHEFQMYASLPDTELFGRVTHWIRRSKSLSELLDAIVHEVGDVLTCDRVKIYQFNSDETGTVVAEWIREHRLPSLLGLMFPADDIPPDARELFTRTGARSVVNLADRQIGQTGIDPTAPDEIRYRPLSPCHAEYLTAMGVQSSLVVPILQEANLWGLLVIHHVEARSLLEAEVNAVQMVVDLLTMAIAQFQLIEQSRARADRESTLHRISCLLHSLSTIELQSALETAVAAFQGSGGRLWVTANSLAVEGSPQNLKLLSTCVRLFQCGSQPVIPEMAPFALLEEYSAFQERFQSEQDAVWAIADLYHEPALRNLQPAFRSVKIRGLLILPLWYRQELLGYLTIFRDEIDTEILWAGRVDPDQRQLYPRQSFEVWCESRRGQTQPWTAGDLELGCAIAHQFSSAIQQYETHQHVQKLNASLEIQVQERTARLQEATEQQHVLFSVVTNMRKSLQVEQICATATEELRRSLNVDRVCVYQFDLDRQYNTGQVVAENVVSGLSSVLGTRIEDHCFGERFATQYRHGRVSSISDVEALVIEPCYLAILERLAVRAHLIAPILRGDELWGLLCVQQCDRPRNWTKHEIQFVKQVAIQLTIGLEQAELLLQTQHQAQQIEAALESLKHTQAQLIQTEKMSSLGRLVAGVAHEINNPVSFIHGNLNHLKHYTFDMLKLLDTYQAVYPEPRSEVLDLIESVDFEFVRQDLPKMLASMQVGTERIREIVLSLRNFSRLDHAEMKPVDIHEGIESTLMILQHRLKANAGDGEVAVIKEYAELPLVECYAGQLNQVFMNLLSNAIDALETVESPEIRIRTKQIEGDRVLIAIADNGCGISPETQRRIFDPFFTTKEIGKGTGMGLAISYEVIVRDHQGSLNCHSELGQGSEFWIEIPIRQSISA